MKCRIIKELLLSLFLISNHANADVRLWLSNTATDGNIGGRAGADALCVADTNNPLVVGSETRAFLSVNANDEIRDLPENYNVPRDETIFRVDGTTQIATDFAALLNAETTPLSTTIGGARNAFTGSGSNGALVPLSGLHCNNWTSNSSSLSGLSGDSNSINQFYITGSAGKCDLDILRLYCISYKPPQPLVVVAPAKLTTAESGIPVSYEIVLTQIPSAGETVTINVASNDVTEGTVSPASLMFNESNWDTPQTVTVTPGASGDGNDGDVSYEISNTVTSTGGGTDFDGTFASNVAVTNQNIDGVSTVTVQPSSGAGLFIDEGSFVDVTVAVAGIEPGSTDFLVIPISTASTEITLSAAFVILNSANGFSNTLRITAVTDAVVDANAAFTVITGAVTGLGLLTGLNPVDIVGTAVNTDVAEPVDEDICTAIKASADKVVVVCL